MAIKIHTKEDFEGMRRVGQLTAKLLKEIKKIIEPGIRTIDIDHFAAQFISKHNAISATLGYKGHNDKEFPGNICTSPNHVICHGIPGEYILKDGDILSVDVTLILDGWHGDSCHTFPVGNISKAAQNLINTAKIARKIGIEAVKPGGFVGDIGHAIKKYIGPSYGIVEDYCGHGIGRKFHDTPEIPHTGELGIGPEIRPGMFFTVEPMINLGSKNTRLLNDGWTVITKDYSLSAQFEHTIGVTEDAVEIFTQDPDLEI